MSGRVVVVEDHRDVALAIEFAFRALGQRVELAHDAPSALHAIAVHSPDLVLIDIVLPAVDGWALARAIRALALLKQPRLVAMSGLATPSDHARSHEAGFETHLAKPIGVADLARLIAIT